MFKALTMFFYFSLFSLQTYASLDMKTAELTGFGRTDRNRVYLLKNKTPGLELILDCSSFFHNLAINAQNENLVFYLTWDECSTIFEYLIYIQSEPRCLDYNSSTFRFHGCF